jgi:hypothetical protein
MDEEPGTSAAPSRVLAGAVAGGGGAVPQGGDGDSAREPAAAGLETPVDGAAPEVANSAGMGVGEGARQGSVGGAAPSADVAEEGAAGRAGSAGAASGGGASFSARGGEGAFASTGMPVEAEDAVSSVYSGASAGGGGGVDSSADGARAPTTLGQGQVQGALTRLIASSANLRRFIVLVNNALQTSTPGSKRKRVGDADFIDAGSSDESKIAFLQENLGLLLGVMGISPEVLEALPEVTTKALPGVEKLDALLQPFIDVPSKVAELLGVYKEYGLRKKGEGEGDGDGAYFGFPVEEPENVLPCAVESTRGGRPMSSAGFLAATQRRFQRGFLMSGRIAELLQGSRIKCEDCGYFDAAVVCECCASYRMRCAPCDFFTHFVDGGGRLCLRYTVREVVAVSNAPPVDCVVKLGPNDTVAAPSCVFNAADPLPLHVRRWQDYVNDEQGFNSGDGRAWRALPVLGPDTCACGSRLWRPRSIDGRVVSVWDDKYGECTRQLAGPCGGFSSGWALVFP